MIPYLNDLFAVCLLGVVLYKLSPRIRRRYDRWRAMRHLKTPWARQWARSLPEYPPPPPPVPPTVPRIAFDREAQMSRMTGSERRVFEAMVPKRGPVLIAEAQKPRPKQIIITHAEARMIEEFVPDFAVQPGRWLYIGDWPEGWEDEE